MTPAVGKFLFEESRTGDEDHEEKHYHTPIKAFLPLLKYTQHKEMLMLLFDLTETVGTNRQTYCRAVSG